MSEAYQAAGVDLAGADALVHRIRSAVISTWSDRIVGGFGGFAGGFRIPPGYERPVLMMSTDGVGTKLDIARRAGRYEGVGIDLVAMSVDDLAAAGAAPLAFTDYLAVGSLDLDRDTAIVESIAEGCRRAGCALIGGETAEHPGTMAADAFDLAGAAVGVVEESVLLTGDTITPGDLVIGLHSPNLRSNGFSLVRKVLDRFELDAAFPGVTRTVAEVLLEPSVIYAPAVVPLAPDPDVHGFAHVTGGGLPGNLGRVLPPGTAAVIDRSTWTVPSVFSTIQRVGKLTDEDMTSVFNLGVGFLIVAAPAAAARLIDAVGRHGHSAAVIGHIVAGRGAVTVV